jgi:hypothetical protein
MTIDFATLDEAWGQPHVQSPAAANKKPKKNKTKSKLEPICALSNPTELEDVMEEYYYAGGAPYDKNPYSRTQRALDDTDAPAREVAPQNVEIVEPEPEPEREPQKTKTAPQTTTAKTQMPDTSQVMEMIIYVSSGILLIFMMEQFIQLGVQLRA